MKQSRRIMWFPHSSWCLKGTSIALLLFRNYNHSHRFCHALKILILSVHANIASPVGPGNKFGLISCFSIHPLPLFVFQRCPRLRDPMLWAHVGHALLTHRASSNHAWCQKLKGIYEENKKILSNMAKLVPKLPMNAVHALFIYAFTVYLTLKGNSTHSNWILINLISRHWL